MPPLIQGLEVSLCTGLFQGLNTVTCGGVAAPVLLTDVSWATPVEFLEADMEGANAATYYWDCQQASGNLTEAGAVANDALISSGGATGNLYQQTALGVYYDAGSGAGWTNRYAVEIEATAAGQVDRFRASSNTSILKGSVGSVGVRVVARFSETTGTANSRLLGHVNGSVNGWFLQIRSGKIRVVINDGTTTQNIDGTETYTDGSWEMYEVILDHTAEEVRIRTARETITASISTITLANLTGSDFSVCGAGTGGVARGAQVAGVWGWEGSTAESLDSDAIADIWKHGADPNAGTKYELDNLGTGTTTNYTGIHFAPGPLDGGPTAMAYAGASRQIVLGYDPGDDSIGMSCNRSEESTFIDYSDDISQWTATNCTVTTIAGDLVDSPRKFRESQLVTCDINAGYVASNTTAVTTEDWWGFSFWLRRRAGTTVTGIIQLYNVTDTVVEDSQTFSLADDDWFNHRGMFRNTTASKTYEWRVVVDTAGDAISLALCNAVTENNQRITPWAMYTEGVSVLLDDYAPTAVDSAGTFGSGAEGTYIVEGSRWDRTGASFNLGGTGELGYAFSLSDGATNNNRLLGFVASDSQLTSDLNDASGGAITFPANYVAANQDILQGFSMRCDWKNTEALFSSGVHYSEAQGTVDASSQTKGATTSSWTGTADGTSLTVGAIHSGTTLECRLSGIVRRIRIWDTAEITP